MSPSSRRKARVLLLDGHSLAYRAFYALPPDLSTSTGQLTNAVYGFTSMLIKALQDFGTKHVAVAFDRGAPLERLEIRPEYKAQRESAPDEFRQQMGLIREVLTVLRIPIFEIENVEADDVISVLARRVAAEKAEAIVVTADRDFFQLVGPRIKLMMNRRGISDTVIYDEAAVRQRYGFGPDRYLDYAALRGDPSDNIEGVAGVGEKTATRLIKTYGSLEGIFENLDELTPKLRENLAAARDRLLENREFFRFRRADELAVGGAEVGLLEASAEELRMGEWDLSEIRSLFDTLEFRTLYERLAADLPQGALGPGFDTETVEISSLADLRILAKELADVEEIILSVAGDPGDPRGEPTGLGILYGGVSRAVRTGGELGPDALWSLLRPALAGTRLVTHGAKDALVRLGAAGVEVGEIVMDTEIAAYIVDPARGNYDLAELVRHFLEKELRSGDAEGQGSLLEAPEGGRDLGMEAEAIGDVAAVLSREIAERGAADLLNALELPLTRVLAKMERAGIKVDVPYLESLGSSMADELRTLEEEIFQHAGGPFNINSPPQLREVLFERLELKPTKKTKTGYSTDASVLEKLREEHPIVDAILRFRERSKLKSTYIDALPRLVDLKTGRLHCRFNQTVATTGRLSSDSPNLQNIPIRTEEGRQIRRAFIPEDRYVLLKCDYSQIELRVLAHLSGDPELRGAFERGDDVHRASIAKALGISEDEVTPELRNVGKMVSYGVTYGMGPYGLSQRLRIPVDAARGYIEGFFALYPRVREYLDEVVARAAESGYTTTIFGRRRYLPELRSRSPRIRSLGERMALNAPIQGSAADLMKAAMVEVDGILEEPSRMILTVHDELVFEVPEGDVARVRREAGEAMERIGELEVPLIVDAAAGPNWNDLEPL